MAPKTPHSAIAALWALARRQHWVVSRKQLLELGFGADWIRHRISRGRLHPVRRGVYAVGRPAVSQFGEWMAAVLCCGDEAFLSHMSAAALWRFRTVRGIVEVSVRAPRDPRPPGIRVHRRKRLLPENALRHENIPVTGPVRTLIDIAPRLPTLQLEAAINEADKRDLVDPEALRAGLERRPGERGVAMLRALLDRGTFTLTDSELERRFLRIVERVGLPRPLTGEWVYGFKVDSHIKKPKPYPRAGAGRGDRRPALPPHPCAAGP